LYEAKLNTINNI